MLKLPPEFVPMLKVPASPFPCPNCLFLVTPALIASPKASVSLARLGYPSFNEARTPIPESATVKLTESFRVVSEANPPAGALA